MNRNQPQPAPGAPRCPSWLSKAAKAEWRRVVKALEPTGMLTQADQAVLAGYSQAVAELQAATELLEREGRTTRAESGYLAPHPTVSMQRSAWSAVKAFSALLGLDPSSRSRLTVSEPRPEPDESEKFLCGGVGWICSPSRSLR